MKYEDFKQISNIVSQIHKHEENLKDLNSTSELIDVQIKFRNKSYGIFTIGIEPMSEHEYAPQARVLIEGIKGDLQRRIDNLKSMLEQL